MVSEQGASSEPISSLPRWERAPQREQAVPSRWEPQGGYQIFREPVFEPKLIVVSFQIIPPFLQERFYRGSPLILPSSFRILLTDTFSSIEVSTKNTDSGKLILSFQN